MQTIISLITDAEHYFSVIELTTAFLQIAIILNYLNMLQFGLLQRNVLSHYSHMFLVFNMAIYVPLYLFLIKTIQIYNYLKNY